MLNLPAEDSGGEELEDLEGSTLAAKKQFSPSVLKDYKAVPDIFKSSQGLPTIILHSEDLEAKDLGECFKKTNQLCVLNFHFQGYNFETIDKESLNPQDFKNFIGVIVFSKEVVSKDGFLDPQVEPKTALFIINLNFILNQLGVSEFDVFICSTNLNKVLPLFFETKMELTSSNLFGFFQENLTGFYFKKELVNAKIIQNNYFISQTFIEQPPQKKEETVQREALSNQILKGLTKKLVLNKEIYYVFKSPIWVEILEDEVFELIREELIKKTKQEFVDARLLSYVKQALDANTRRNIPFDPPKLNCFKNGVLNVETGKINLLENPLEFQDYYFRDFLPYALDPELPPVHTTENFKEIFTQNCPKIYSWFIEMLEDWEVCLTILAFAAAILKNIPLDKFLFFIGNPQTGKSTAINFFDKLFLKESVASYAQNDLGKTFGLQQLTTTNIRLITIRDAGENMSAEAINMLKSLTSAEEPISIDRKYSSRVNTIFRGGVIIASNYLNIFTKNSIGILDRRMLGIKFNKRIRDTQIKPVSELFPPDEIEFFINLTFKWPSLLIQEILIKSKNLAPIKMVLEEQMEDSVLSFVQDFVEEKFVFSEGSFIPSGFSLNTRKNLAVPTLLGEYEVFLSLNTSQRTPENPSKLNNKLTQIFYSLNWGVIGSKKKYLLFKDGEKREVRGYLNLAWKDPSRASQAPQTEAFGEVSFEEKNKSI